MARSQPIAMHGWFGEAIVRNDRETSHDSGAVDGLNGNSSSERAGDKLTGIRRFADGTVIAGQTTFANVSACV